MTVDLKALREAFGDRLHENVMLANYVTTRVGGPARAFLAANHLHELEEFASRLWQMGVPFRVLGSGSNVLVSDAGYDGVILLNRARNVRIDARSTPPTVLVESGANLSGLARQVAVRGLAGLEWAATIPGTLGGAVVNNAGAFGGDMAGNLLLAEILHPIHGRATWTAEQMGYAYRTSAIKQQENKVLVLTARLKLEQSTPEKVKAQMDANLEKRRATQPPGATMGSTFKNPPGDYAGRLIEAAGLKGTIIGGAQISPMHANFLMNISESASVVRASANDFWQLIELARNTVKEKFGVQLELEIELLGKWTHSKRK
ncbi:MAG TPA: UDP-N-acetylmuramate dehydrogenase [Anaerolineaceae bacterium]|nr:UDP-N-acetylmuramate dehydrogenase [Anaerolineaceae bacterium]